MALFSLLTVPTTMVCLPVFATILQENTQKEQREKIVDYDSGERHGFIDEAPETYNVIGKHQRIPGKYWTKQPTADVKNGR